MNEGVSAQCVTPSLLTGLRNFPGGLGTGVGVGVAESQRLKAKHDSSKNQPLWLTF